MTCTTSLDAVCVREMVESEERTEVVVDFISPIERDVQLRELINFRQLETSLDDELLALEA